MKFLALFLLNWERYNWSLKISRLLILSSSRCRNTHRISVLFLPASLSYWARSLHYSINLEVCSRAETWKSLNVYHEERSELKFFGFLIKTTSNRKIWTYIRNTLFHHIIYVYTYLSSCVYKSFHHHHHHQHLLFVKEKKLNCNAKRRKKNQEKNYYDYFERFICSRKRKKKSS